MLMGDRVKTRDLHDNMKSLFTDNELFAFAPSDINRMRQELLDVIVHITKTYQEKRLSTQACVVNLEEFSDDDTLPRVLDSSGRDNETLSTSSSNSQGEMSDGSIWEPTTGSGCDLDESFDHDDDEFIADTQGK